MTPSENERMFSQIEEQQAVLQNSIDDSKRLMAKSDQLIDQSRAQKMAPGRAED